MVATLAALDLWTIFVNYIGGNFWLAIVIISILIGGVLVLGRTSIYTTMWYLGLFWLVMVIGYGFLTLAILITTLILTGFYFSMKGYFDRAGQ